MPYLTVFWCWYYINDDDDKKQLLYCLVSALSLFDIKAPFLLLRLLRWWVSEGNNILARYLRSTTVERSTIWDFMLELSVSYNMRYDKQRWWYYLRSAGFLLPWWRVFRLAFWHLYYTDVDNLHRLYSLRLAVVILSIIMYFLSFSWCWDFMNNDDHQRRHIREATVGYQP